MLTHPMPHLRQNHLVRLRRPHRPCPRRCRIRAMVPRAPQARTQHTLVASRQEVRNRRARAGLNNSMNHHRLADRAARARRRPARPHVISDLDGVVSPGRSLPGNDEVLRPKPARTSPDCAPMCARTASSTPASTHHPPRHGSAGNVAADAACRAVVEHGGVFFEQLGRTPIRQARTPRRRVDVVDRDRGAGLAVGEKHRPGLAPGQHPRQEPGRAGLPHW